MLRSLTALQIHVFGEKAGKVHLPENLRRLELMNDIAEKLNVESAPHIEYVRVALGMRGRTNGASGDLDLAGQTKWLRSLLELRELVLDGPADQDAQHVARLASLCALTVTSDCPSIAISDSGMMALAELPKLESLEIENGWRLTDTGMTLLRGLPSLRRLGLTGSFPGVTAAGLAWVWEMKCLRTLKLNLYEHAGDWTLGVILPRLKVLSELEELSVSGAVADDGLASLADLKKLRRLDLTHAVGYSDTGLESLVRSLPELRELRLSMRQGP